MSRHSGANTGMSYREQSFDALPFPLLLLNRQLHILDMNPQAELLFDQAMSSARGRKLEEWILPSCEIYPFLEAAMTGFASLTEQQLKLELVSGRTLIGAARMAPCAEPDVFVLSLFPEVGSDKMPGRTRDQAKIPFVSMVSMLAHEIKNPLSGIKGAAQLLEFSTADADRELATMIADEVDRLTVLVDEFEVFGAGRAPDGKPTNIHSILAHCRQVAISGFANFVEFNESYDPSLPEISCDEAMLKQVFINILKNAAEALEQAQQAVPETGKQTEAAARPQISMSTSFHGAIKYRLKSAMGQVPSSPRSGRGTPFLVVSIEDNGPGIDEAIAQSLFQPSVSSKRGGKGLGLALAAKIVSDHKGWIDFSTGFRRTRFDVYLPIGST